MFCTKCGNQIKDGYKFCTKCGAPAVGQEAAQRTPMMQPAAEKTPVTQPAAAKKNKAGSAVKIIIIILAVLIVAAIGILLIILSGNPIGDKLPLIGKSSGKTERKESRKKDEVDKLLDDAERADSDSDTRAEGNSAPEGPSTDQTEAAAATATPERAGTGEHHPEEIHSSENGHAGKTEEVPPKKEYILEGSDTRYLTKDDLRGFTADMCRVARNEIYARHGRKFKDQELQEYFNGCSWYVPSIEPDDFKESVLNDYEIANRDLIVAYEKEKGYR